MASFNEAIMHVKIREAENAEILRLREALEIIKSGYPRGDGSFLDRVQMKEIATEALSSEEVSSE